MRFFEFTNRRAINDFRAYATDRAVAFNDLDSFEENTRKLSILDPLLDRKRFAYVGESNHFIHEKYAYRLVMLNYLTTRGFTHLGEELGASDGTRIDRFIATGDESQLERIAMYGYAGAIREDRNDRPTGILRDSFDSYPTAQFAAEQKRFAHGLRRIGIRFFGFDIDPLPGGGYEDLAETLGSINGDPAINAVRTALQHISGETIDQEIARLDEALRMIEANPRLRALRPSATCLRDSFEYVRITYPAKTFDALNPGMAFRERFMHRQVDRALAQMQTNEKLVLMSHNMHLCRAPEAVAGSDAAAGPGGKTDLPLGAWLASRFPGEVFSVWMLIGRGTDSQPFPSLSNKIHEKPGTLNAILGEIGDCFLLPIDTTDSRARLLTEPIQIMHDANGGVVTAIAKHADSIFFVRDVTPLRI